jgi:FkbM family methyltransferase
VTFEPDATNFHCLKINVPQSNVTMYQQALGDKSDLVALEPNQRWMESNRGALRTSGPGNIPQVTIDSLCLAPDLVHLDIEGFEALALLGAQQTIANHRPMIALETNGSGDAYDWPQHKIDALLKSWGYRVLESWQHDTVYTYENN